MTDSLQEPLGVLSDEVGITPPLPDQHGVYHIDIDGKQLRLFSLSQGRIILLGVIGSIGTISALRNESRERLLASCLTLQAVRFGKLGTMEVLTIEPETDELILWYGFEDHSLSIPNFLSAAESMLNELDFWKNWLATA